MSGWARKTFGGKTPDYSKLADAQLQLGRDQLAASKEAETYWRGFADKVWESYEQQRQLGAGAMTALQQGMAEGRFTRPPMQLPGGTGATLPVWGGGQGGQSVAPPMAPSQAYRQPVNHFPQQPVAPPTPAPMSRQPAPTPAPMSGQPAPPPVQGTAMPKGHDLGQIPRGMLGKIVQAQHQYPRRER